MDDSKVTLGDDEFHFSEADEASSDPYTLTEDEAPKSSKFSRRNILIAIGIIVVALSLYKLIGVFFGASSTKKTTVATTSAPAKTASVTASASNNNQQATLNNAVSEQQAPAVQIQSQSEQSKKMQDQLSQMQETDNAHSQQMQQVSNQLSSLAESVRSLNETVASMSQNLQSVSSELQSQEMSIATLKAKPRAVKRVTRPVAYHRPAQWYVQAIIPGRAWLGQSNGLTTTVSVGDILKGYGKVKTISVINGTVKLSSGAILKFRDS